MRPRHLLRVLDLGAETARALIERALMIKRQNQARIFAFPGTGKIVGLLFEKPSTRTRVSFEAAALRLGGETVFMSARELQLARGEPLKDTARVLSRYLDLLVVRTFGQEVVEELAEWSSIPVINGLTDQHHPCQALSDFMTVMEAKGRDLSGLKAAWVGDGNNVAHSWIEAAALLGLELVLACPEGYEPERRILEEAERVAARPITLVRDPREAVRGAHVVSTDVWTSMGKEGESEERRRVFEPYQVNEALLEEADPEAVVLHCLPAHRGEEITEEVLEGPRSLVWDQAENKMHLHAAVLEWAMELGQ